VLCKALVLTAGPLGPAVVRYTRTYGKERRLRFLQNRRGRSSCAQGVAFLDIHPIRPGHTLVVPKVHEQHLHHLSEDTFVAVMRVVRQLSSIIEQKLMPKRVGLLVAGWDVPHAHVHVIPMEDYHDITSKVILDNQRGNPSQEELTALAEKIRG
jgi:histidine triad (HIT) family protein